MKFKLSPFFLIPLLVCGEPALAGVIDERLDSLVSHNASEIVSKFGVPVISTPNRLIYTFNPSPAGFSHGAPAPVDGFTQGTGSGMGPDSGVALQSPRPLGRQLPCRIEFDLDSSSTVKQVRHSGPGCYEIVYGRTIAE
jgi:hypothetical protein